jgi:hypothetical protein
MDSGPSGAVAVAAVKHGDVVNARAISVSSRTGIRFVTADEQHGQVRGLVEWHQVNAALPLCTS